MTDYGADPAKVHIIPWGVPILKKRRIAAPCFKERKPGPCRLLFVGVSWEEKGADDAVGTLNEPAGPRIVHELG